MECTSTLAQVQRGILANTHDSYVVQIPNYFAELRLLFIYLFLRKKSLEIVAYIVSLLFCFFFRLGEGKGFKNAFFPCRFHHLLLISQLKE